MEHFQISFVKLLRKPIRLLAQHKSMHHFEHQNVEYFLNEISDLGVKDPTLVALGTPILDILNRNLSDRYKILKIGHYAFRENKEKYLNHVEKVCGKYL